jgi:hypothetical protein
MALKPKLSDIEEATPDTQKSGAKIAGFGLATGGDDDEEGYSLQSGAGSPAAGFSANAEKLRATMENLDAVDENELFDYYRPNRRVNYKSLNKLGIPSSLRFSPYQEEIMAKIYWANWSPHNFFRRKT